MIMNLKILQQFSRNQQFSYHTKLIIIKQIFIQRPQTSCLADAALEYDYESEDLDFQYQYFHSQYFRKQSPLWMQIIVGNLPLIMLGLQLFYQYWSDSNNWRYQRPPPLDFSNEDDKPDNQFFRIFKSEAHKYIYYPGTVNPPFFQNQRWEKVYTECAGVNQQENQFDNTYKYIINRNIIIIMEKQKNCMGNKWKVNIEYCKSCDTHNWCTHHDQQKYRHAYIDLMNALRRQIPQLQIIGNQIPKYLTPIKQKQNKFYDTKNKKYMLFPAIGAFEVYLNQNLIFSKKNTNTWPNNNNIVDQIYKNVKKGVLRKSPSQASVAKTQKVGISQIFQKQTVKRANSQLKNLDANITFHSDYTKNKMTLTDHFKRYKMKKNQNDFQSLYAESEIAKYSRIQKITAQDIKKLHPIWGKKQDIPNFIKNKAYIQQKQGKKQMLINLSSIQQQSELKQIQMNVPKRKKKKISNLDIQFQKLQNKMLKFQNKVSEVNNKNFQSKQIINKDKIKKYNKVSLLDKINQIKASYHPQKIVQNIKNRKKRKIQQYIHASSEEKNQRLSIIYGPQFLNNNSFISKSSINNKIYKKSSTKNNNNNQFEHSSKNQSFRNQSSQTQQDFQQQERLQEQDDQQNSSSQFDSNSNVSNKRLHRQTKSAMLNKFQKQFYSTQANFKRASKPMYTGDKWRKQVNNFQSQNFFKGLQNQKREFQSRSLLYKPIKIEKSQKNEERILENFGKTQKSNQENKIIKSKQFVVLKQNQELQNILIQKQQNKSFQKADKEASFDQQVQKITKIKKSIRIKNIKQFQKQKQDNQNIRNYKKTQQRGSSKNTQQQYKIIEKENLNQKNIQNKNYLKKQKEINSQKRNKKLRDVKDKKNQSQKYQNNRQEYLHKQQLIQDSTHRQIDKNLWKKQSKKKREKQKVKQIKKKNNQQVLIFNTNDAQNSQVIQKNTKSKIKSQNKKIYISNKNEKKFNYQQKQKQQIIQNQLEERYSSSQQVTSSSPDDSQQNSNQSSQSRLAQQGQQENQKMFQQSNNTQKFNRSTNNNQASQKQQKDFINKQITKQQSNEIHSPKLLPQPQVQKVQKKDFHQNQQQNKGINQDQKQVKRQQVYLKNPIITQNQVQKQVKQIQNKCSSYFIQIQLHNTNVKKLKNQRQQANDQKYQRKFDEVRQQKNIGSSSKPRKICQISQAIIEMVDVGAQKNRPQYQKESQTLQQNNSNKLLSNNKKQIKKSINQRIEQLQVQNKIQKQPYNPQKSTVKYHDYVQSQNHNKKQQKNITNQKLEFADQQQQKELKTIPQQNAAISKQFYGKQYNQMLKKHKFQQNQFQNNAKLYQKKWVKIKGLYKQQKSVIFDKESIQPQLLADNSGILANFCKVIQLLCTRNQFLIIRLFQNPSVGSSDSYGMWLCDNYTWKYFIVANKVQVNGKSQPIYIHHKGFQKWAVIMVEALAKLFNGYNQLAKIQVSQLFHALTGSNYISFKVKEDPDKNNKLLKFITINQKKNFIILAQKRMQNYLSETLQQNKKLKIFYILSQKIINNNQILLRMKKGNSDAFWIKLQKFVIQFYQVDILQLRVNHNFSILTLNECTSGCFKVIELSFNEQSFGCVAVVSEHKNTDFKLFLYKEQQDNVLRLVGQINQKNKKMTFFDCCFEQGKYLIFADIKNPTNKISYMGQNKPQLHIKQQIQQAGLRSNFTQYIPINNPQPNRRQSEMPKFLNMTHKNENNDIINIQPHYINNTSKKRNSNRDLQYKIDKQKLKNQFVDYLMNN